MNQLRATGGRPARGNRQAAVRAESAAACLVGHRVLRALREIVGPKEYREALDLMPDLVTAPEFPTLLREISHHLQSAHGRHD